MVLTVDKTVLDDGNERVAAMEQIALAVFVTLQTDSRGVQCHDVVVLMLRLAKVEEGFHGCHGADGRVGREVGDEVERQHTFKQAHLVDVSCHHLCRCVLIQIGGSQGDVVAHNARQTVGGKRLDLFLVDIDISHVARP